MTTREQVREYINNRLLKDAEEAIHLEDSTSMVKSGLINSMAIVELIAYVEDTFQISVADPDINIDDFDSIDNICLLIARHQVRM